MKKNNAVIGYIQLAGAMILAGSSVVMAKYLLSIPIFLSQSIALFFALLIIFPAALILEGPFSDFKIPIKDWFLLFFQAVCGMFLFRIFLFIGLRYTSATSSGIILSTTPAVLVIFSFIFLNEKLNIRTVVGILFCIGGISLINLNVKGVEASPESTFLGTFLILLCVTLEALFTILRKKQSTEDRPITATAFIILFVFILCLPGTVVELQHFNLNQISAVQVFRLLYFGICCSALAYILWLSGLPKVKVSQAAAMSGIMPMTSVLLSSIFLGENFTITHICGMLLIFGGIYTITVRISKAVKIKV